MIDFSRIEQYRENNRIEAKKALGGLPKSIWETYSAFANTYGGIILLGVVELPDKSFRPIDLPDPGRLIREFWDIVNDPDKTSVNILSSRDVFIQEVEGKHIVVINVPRAERFDKPVYVNGSPLCTYRRNGEGDYRCTAEEFEAMARDASVKTQDMRLLEGMDMAVFDRESIRSYRQRMRICRPGHVWEILGEEAFLLKLGAAGTGTDGKNHPTAAGLLMFGREYDILEEFKTYSLDYREENEAGTDSTRRIFSSSGGWSGNVYDFFFRVCDRLIQNVKVPFEGDGEERTGDSPVHQALREALANCLINADYYSRQGVVIVKKTDSITMVNPGGFRIKIGAAKSGGVSDPRNGIISKMFHLVDIGERTGSGIPNIFRIWRQQGWAAPSIEEQSEPERTLLKLPFGKNGEEKRMMEAGGRTPEISAGMKAEVIVYLTDHSQARASEIAGYLGMGTSRAAEYLNELIEEGVVVTEGDSRNKVYRLKSDPL